MCKILGWLLLSGFVFFGCGGSNSSSGETGNATSGGAVSLGGATSTGGVASTGGTPGAGGSVGSGGASTGGAATGGATLGGVSSTGGTKNTGGNVSTGGAKSTGGNSGTGGTTQKVSITIHFTGAGTGMVGDGSAALDWGGSLCTQDCVLTYSKVPTLNKIILARPVNGSGSYFGGFSGDCTGLGACTLPLDGDHQVTVEFRAQQYNFVFISSTTPDNIQSSVTSFDTECNRLATNAGINNTAGDGYVAWVSDSHSSALSRLGTTARGFVLLDEKPVADTVASLLAGQIYYPIRVDDKIQTLNNSEVRTGTLADGSASTDNCSNWASDASGYALTVGLNSGGPGAWTNFTALNCLNPPRINCFGKTLSKELVVQKTPGKLIYLSAPYTPGSVTPDAACAASAPANTGPVVALLPSATAGASSLLDTTALYVRPDGMPVGTGAEIITASVPVYGTDPSDKYLRSGIWQAGDGSYPMSDAEPLVWVGDSVMTRASAATCGNWTSTTGSTRVGNYHVSNPLFWNLEGVLGVSPTRNCSLALRLYCIEK